MVKLYLWELVHCLAHPQTMDECPSPLEGDIAGRSCRSCSHRGHGGHTIRSPDEHVGRCQGVRPHAWRLAVLWPAGRFQALVESLCGEGATSPEPMRPDRTLRMEEATRSARDWLLCEHSQDITWGPQGCNLV